MNNADKLVTLIICLLHCSISSAVVIPPNLSSSPNYTPFTASVATAVDQMSQHVTNAGQTQLLNYFAGSTSNANLVYNLNQMLPNINTNAGNFTAQNTLMSKVETRSGAILNRMAAKGIANGEICKGVAVWAGGFGNVAKQRQYAEGLNTGYRLRSLGGIVGIDGKITDSIIFGMAVAVANVNVHEMAHANYGAHTMSYYGLLYGSWFYNNLFSEWVLAGATNANQSSRPVNMDDNNLAVNSKYYGWQGGIKLNIGNYSDWCQTIRFSHLLSFQYSYLHQPGYQEYGSVAALYVTPNANQSLATVGTGIRLAVAENDPWATGSKEVHALITYDVIHPQQTTLANFVVGSPSFSMTNIAQARIAYIAGAIFSLTFFDNWLLEVSYDFEWRSGYYDNVGEARLKFMF